ncbi:MAG: MerR family transcriptional regulator [Candidatus Marinimicrobia bacterium]|nr:MerR family transcriptional regulator [Candidatus Neomarinimicrobiota bacterium]MCH8837786.1 MerR family transcriptional regulator [Candidatus Neomarinimicrobiota bacterium]
MLTTSQLANSAGVNVETLRYYERRGLLPEPPRRASGYRQYSQDDVARLQFIKRAKDLGFTLQEVQELLNLRVDPDTPCAMVKRRADLKIIDIEAKLQSLKRIKKALNKLAATCSGRGPVGDCPILEALGGDGTW